MRSTTNNFTTPPGYPPTRHDYGSYAPNNNDWDHRPMFPLSVPVQASRDASRGAQDPWSFEERVITGPFGLYGFREQPYTPVRILVVGNDIGREVNPRPRQFIQESPPRFTSQRNMQVPTVHEEESKLTQDEQKKALKKLKKEIYNPVPKGITRRLSLYYRDHARNSVNEKEKEKEEDGKRCAVCLDDFEPKQEVLVTPCNHMFHEDCIVPWVKSNGQCPVCRSALCDRMRETAPLSNYSNFRNVPANDLFEGEIISVIRAMEEAFQRGRVPY